jgi:hypothetical protein
VVAGIPRRREGRHTDRQTDRHGINEGVEEQEKRQTDRQTERERDSVKVTGEVVQRRRGGASRKGDCNNRA